MKAKVINLTEIKRKKVIAQYIAFYGYRKEVQNEFRRVDGKEAR